MGAGRRWRRLGAGVVVLLAMTGCSDADGDEVPTAAATPRVSETTTDSPSESPAPGPTPWPEPTRPAAMERDDIEGAKAAAEYFLALHPYIFATGALDEWNSMSHPECQFCNGAAEHVAELFSVGGYGLGGEFIVEDVQASSMPGEESRYLVDVSGVETPSVEYSSDGNIVRDFEGGPLVYNIGVVRDGDVWVVRGVSWEE